MDEQQTATETTAATTEAPALSAREQAMAALGDDVATTDEAAPVAAPVEAAKPVVEPLSPKLAHLAREDARVQAGKQELKAEREAFAAERAKAAEAGSHVDAVHRLVSSDLVAYADAQKWTAAQRTELATALGWSAQPEEKRPAGWRGNGNGKVMSEVERAVSAAEKVAKEFEAYKQEVAAKEQTVAQQQRQHTVVEQIVSGIPDGAKLTRAFLKSNATQARSDLWTLANQMAKANPEAELTPQAIADEYEKFLDSQSAWIREAYGTAPVAPKAAVTAGQRTLSNGATASPTRAVGEPQTSEERRAAAIAALGE